MKRETATGNFEVLLNAFQKDALTELGNIASGHAVTALSEMTGKTMEVEVPTVDVMMVKEVRKQLDAEDLVAGILLQLDGGFSGYLEVLFPGKSALRLIDFLMGRMPGETRDIETTMEESVLKEVGNVLASSFCDAIAEFFQFSLLPSPPSFSFGMLGAVVEKGMTAAIETTENVEHIIRFKYVFENENENDIHGYILLFPHPRELKSIVSLLEAKVA